MLKIAAALVLLLAVGAILQIDNEKSFSAFGAVGPVLSITSPTNNTNTSIGNHVVTGTASDTSGKIRVVLVATSSGQFKATPKATNDWSTWSISINFTNPGPNTITAKSVDDMRHASHISIQVMVGATPTTVPSAPQNLQATGSNAQMSLTWQAPLSSGGTAITNYNIYRSTSSGSETLLTTVGNVLSYNDAGLTNGQTYYYKVSAVNTVGESSQSNEVSVSLFSITNQIQKITRDKIIISLVRPDLDPTSLANVVSYVKSFSQPTDFIFGGGIPGYVPNWTLDASMPGQIMVGGAGNSTTNFNSWKIAKAQNGISTIFFDEEPTLSLSDVENGYSVAHSLGLKFVTTPLYTELSTSPSIITTIAQNSDIIVLQIYPGMKFTGPDVGLTYAQCVQKYAESARQANPNVKVLVEILNGQTKTNTVDMTKQIDAFNSVKSYVDGVFVWYYQNPDPTPVLKQFYQGTGLVG